MDKIKILIADDHAVVRMGLTALLNAKKDLEVVGQARNGEAAVRETARLKPDVVIMDLMMPKMNGTTATAQICAKAPESRVIILTTFATSDGIQKALDAGAAGALLKNAENAELVSAVRKVAAGERVISPDVQALIAQDPPLPSLTPRQQDVLKSLTRGLTNKGIASQLGISQRSVDDHVEGLLERIGAANRVEAVAIALRKHLLKI